MYIDNGTNSCLCLCLCVCVCVCVCVSATAPCLYWSLSALRHSFTEGEVEKKTPQKDRKITNRLAWPVSQNACCLSTRLLKRHTCSAQSWFQNASFKQTSTRHADTHAAWSNKVSDRQWTVSFVAVSSQCVFLNCRCGRRLKDQCTNRRTAEMAVLP